MNLHSLNKSEQDVLLKIAILEDEYNGIIKDDFDTVPIKGNPYHKCKYCSSTIPEISVYGHHNLCSYGEARKEYVKLSNFLRPEIRANLKYLISEFNTI